MKLTLLLLHGKIHFLFLDTCKKLWCRKFSAQINIQNMLLPFVKEFVHPKKANMRKTKNF